MLSPEPPPSDCSWLNCAVTMADVGGLLTPPESAVVNGRSKNSPAPPRTISFWSPVRSYAAPNRGPSESAGASYVAFGMSPPGRKSPLRRSPVPGTSVPIATELPAPRF